jgi:hypothetical protein
MPSQRSTAVVIATTTTIAAVAFIVETQSDE